VFSGNRQNAKQEAEQYAEAAREQFGTNAVQVLPQSRLQRGTGYEVRIQPGRHEATQVFQRLGELSKTQQRKIVRRAREAGRSVSRKENLTENDVYAALQQDPSIDPAGPGAQEQRQQAVASWTSETSQQSEQSTEPEAEAVQSTTPTQPGTVDLAGAQLDRGDEITLPDGETGTILDISEVVGDTHTKQEVVVERPDGTQQVLRDAAAEETEDDAPVATQRPTLRQQQKASTQYASMTPAQQGSNPFNNPDAYAEATYGAEARALAPMKPGKTRQFVSELGVPASSTLRHYSPRLYGRMKQMEGRVARRQHDLNATLARVFSNLDQTLGRNQTRKLLEVASIRGNDAARQWISDNYGGQAITDATRSFDELLDVKDQVFRDAQRAGVSAGEIEDHFPRMVADYNAWIEYKYGEEPDDLQRMMDQESQRKQRPLTKWERSDIIERWVQGYGPKKPGQTRPRQLGRRTEDSLTPEEFQQYYMDPRDAVSQYVRRLVEASEKNKLLGKAADQEMMDESIGRLMDEGQFGLDELPAWQKKRIKNILHARFTTGEQSPAHSLRVARAMGYISTISDPSAAAIQLGDMALTVARDGVLPSAYGLSKAVVEKTITARNMGMDRIGQEFVTNSKIDRVMNDSFTVTGFRKVDQGMKTANMLSAFKRARKIAKRPDSRRFQQWEEQIRPVFGDEQFDQLVQDLRNGNKESDLVLDYVYMQLSLTQPIELLEMTEK
jgi:hypothetical protein